MSKEHPFLAPSQPILDHAQPRILRVIRLLARTNAPSKCSTQEALRQEHRR
jgi:hypothetical protein